MAPRVGVVVVHYGTEHLTLRCLRALADDAASPARRVVLVDNGPGAGVAARVRAELPDVEVVVPGRNLGFAGGANAGIAVLPDVDHVALLNSDTVPEPGWLGPLVEALDADPRRASASAKLLFEGRFREVRVAAARAWRPGRGDPRELAWRLDGVTARGRDVTGACQLVEGFWEPDRAGTWAGPIAVLRVPDLGDGAAVELRIGAPPGQAVTLHVDGAAPGEVTTPVGGGCIDLVPTGPAVAIVNNAGNEWRPDGYGVDRGFNEVDRGQHDRPGEIPAWCGGAVLLRRAHLEDTGRLDARLFLYYEDLELARRGSARGWVHWYEPAAVVQHRHAASADQRPGRSATLKERNRLLVVARHDGAGTLVRELLRFVLTTASYVRRDVVAALLAGRRPELARLEVRARALVGAVRGAPGMLRSRRQDRRRRRESPRWPDC